DLALRFIVAEVAGRPDRLAVLRIGDQERAAAGERLAEEIAEDLGLVAVAVRMLLPDERIRGNRIERVPVVGPERTELHEVALEHRLKIERHDVLSGGHDFDAGWRRK